MKYGPDDKFWVVTDPTTQSEQGDILFEVSLRSLELQFKGGLTMDQNPTMFTDREEAEDEAYGRLVAMRAAQAVLQSRRECSASRVDRIELYDEEGKLVFEANLTEGGHEQA